jgi:hypothetical protein
MLFLPTKSVGFSTIWPFDFDEKVEVLKEAAVRMLAVTP